MFSAMSEEKMMTQEDRNIYQEKPLIRAVMIEFPVQTVGRRNPTLFHCEQKLGLDKSLH